jgi:hypothetical protein
MGPKKASGAASRGDRRGHHVLAVAAVEELMVPYTRDNVSARL